MAWFVQPLQRKDTCGNPSGLWRLCAESDEGGGFYAGCEHDHASPEEAQDCLDAQRFLGGITGFPHMELSCEAPLPLTFDFTDEEVAAINDLSRRQDLSAIGVMRQALRMYQISVLGAPDLGQMLPPAE
ncbi:hypothetical protein [Devosia lacusdianchii]|uniref:hypothetical protein n=1 Tax=Devosia lacusdianchii TaxID=2917991 RepID=UPI001F05A31A|nr:hypothetical protein [Devosia sp. JXJ CY 41]